MVIQNHSHQHSYFHDLQGGEQSIYTSYLIIKLVSVHLDKLVDKGKLTESLTLSVQILQVFLVCPQVALQYQ